MAQTPFSLLLLRRLSLSSQNPKPPLSLLLSHLSLRPFSTSQPDPPKRPPLSARMNFVFDQIDAIERERSEKDQTLQRIRAWRQSKNAQQEPESESQLGATNDVSCNSSTEPSSAESSLRELEVKKERAVEMVHPWPEWIELMERLVQQNYFDHRRKDEDRMVEDLGFDISEVVRDDVGIDFTRDFKTVQTACLNFGKDRFDIFRSLSRQDIQILVGYGCPSADKKVVFSAKLLRKHVHLDEGDVCSSCSLRSSCERAYLITNKEDEARTIDVMRVLLTFGFDPVNGSVVNKSLLKQKSVKTVVRKLLHEVVKLSAVPIDPNLPPPVLKKPPPKVKQPPPPPKKRVGRDDIEMKKGDWLCPKCDFMNFAKNIVCLQCDAKRPKRQLLPGEWECPECNFLNYRRNMACFHCDCKRPPDEFMENKMQGRQHGPMRLEKTASRPEVSNAWNFDFDDNESDGADVAAFEYADSSVRGEGSPLDGQAHGGNFRGSEDDFDKASRVPRVHEREYSNLHNKPGTGFNDFDDVDDIDSYELDTQNNKPVQEASSNSFPDVEGFSESEDIDDNFPAHRRTSYSSYNKRSEPIRQKTSFSGSEDDEPGFDSDEELSIHPNWKSSHVADSRHRNRSTGPSRGLSFGSDEELGLNSDPDDDLDEDFPSRQRTRNKSGSGKGDFRRRGSSNIEDGSFSGAESDSDELNRLQGNKIEPGRRRNSFKDHGDYNFAKDTQFKSNGKMRDRKDFRRRGSSNIQDRSFSGAESDSDDLRSRRSRSRGNEIEPGRRGNNFKGHGPRGDSNFSRDSEFKFNGKMSDRRNFLNGGFDRSSRGSHGNNKGFRRDDYGGQRNDRRGDMQNFKEPRRGDAFRNRQRGRPYGNDTGMDRDSGEYRNSRRVIER